MKLHKLYLKQEEKEAESPSYGKAKAIFSKEAWAAFDQGKEHPFVRLVDPDEFILEFDYVVPEEGKELTERLKKYLKKIKLNFVEYDHKGLSSHIHFWIPEIKDYEPLARKQIKDHIISEIEKEVIPEYLEYAEWIKELPRDEIQKLNPAQRARLDRFSAKKRAFCPKPGARHYKHLFSKYEPRYAKYEVKKLTDEFGDPRKNYLRINWEPEIKIPNRLEKYVDIPIMEVLQTYGISTAKARKEGKNLKMVNPFHGHTGGTNKNANFAIIPEENKWYSYSNGVGGYGLQLVAIAEGIADYSELGSLTSEQTRKLMATIREKFPDVKIPERKLREEKKAIFHPDFLEFSGKHLRGFGTWKKVLGLLGSEYAPYHKASYYALIAGTLYSGENSKVKMGDQLWRSNSAMDLRFHTTLILPPGRGKNQIKKALEEVFSYSEIKFNAPAAYHEEALIGHVKLSKPNKEGMVKCFPEPGLFQKSDFLFLDEMKDIYAEDKDNPRRKYLILARDEYNRNRIHKAQTGVPIDQQLRYYPHFSSIDCLQPYAHGFTIRIYEEGYMRRNFWIARDIHAVSSENRRSKIFGNSNQLRRSHVVAMGEYIKAVKEHAETTPIPEFPEQLKEKLYNYYSAIANLWRSFNSLRVQNFLKSIDYSIPSYLLKLAYLNMYASLESEIKEHHLDSAFVDTMEFYCCSFEALGKFFPNIGMAEKIKYPIEFKDHLSFLDNAQAHSKDSAIESTLLKKHIIKTSDVNEKKAREIIRAMKNAGFISEIHILRKYLYWLNRDKFLQNSKNYDNPYFEVAKCLKNSVKIGGIQNNLLGGVLKEGNLHTK